MYTSKIIETISTDTSKLQSAWSAYDYRHYGYCDWNAERSFNECVRDFIYSTKLKTPLPENDAGITNPFMDLWFEHSNDRKYPPNNPFADFAAYKEISVEKEAAIKERFLKDILHIPDRYVSYLQFQLCEKITKEYISRTSGKKLDSAHLILESKEILGDLSEFLTDEIIEKFNSISLCAWHDDVCRVYSKSSISEYAISYAYSIFRRGRQYHESLGGTIYDPHWVRRPTQYIEIIDNIKIYSPPGINNMDWGPVLLNLVKDKRISCEKNIFKEILISLREDVQSEKYNTLSTDKEDQVKMLSNAGVYAEYSKPPLHHKLCSIPTDYLANIPVVGPILKSANIVDLFAKSKFIEKMDAKLTYSVGTFQNFEKSFYINNVIGTINR